MLVRIDLLGSALMDFLDEREKAHKGRELEEKTR
jgi:hypothetical protein